MVNKDKVRSPEVRSSEVRSPEVRTLSLFVGRLASLASLQKLVQRIMNTPLKDILRNISKLFMKAKKILNVNLVEKFSHCLYIFKDILKQFMKD